MYSHQKPCNISLVDYLEKISINFSRGDDWNSCRNAEDTVNSRNLLEEKQRIQAEYV